MRLNRAARRLLCPADKSLIFGQPVDRPQADRWPLGSQRLTQQLQPVVDQLRQGWAPREEVQLEIDGGSLHRVSCTASVLLRDDALAGAVVVLREAS